MTDQSLPITLVNGASVDRIAINDRGLQYGDGLFETVKILDGNCLLWDLHVDRLMRGCQRLGIDPQGLLERIECDKEQVLALKPMPQTAILKLVVTRGAGLRGYQPPVGQLPTVILTLSMYQPNVLHYEKGVEVRFCDTPLGINPLLSGIKHLNRLEQVIARGEWDDMSIAEGLMSDIDGHIIEGTMSNIFWVKNGALYTPELERCGIEGTVREQVFLLAEQLGYTVVVDQFTKFDLLMADEVFICNSAIDIWPVVKLAQHSWQVGFVTKQLQSGLEEVYAC